VLQLIALRSTHRQIAARLRLTPDTVKQHTSSAYRRLDARNRAAAMHVAHQIGPRRLTSPSEQEVGSSSAVRPGG
jgi:DNA-binding NarL/FixJ family response regulator